MGFSETGGHGCKKHPDHQEKQGVCPSCLRERLSGLCSSSYKDTANSRIAPSSSPSLSFSPAAAADDDDDYSSASSSNSAFPAAAAAPHRNLHKRNGSWVNLGINKGSSSSFMCTLGTTGLKKSRSIAFVPRNLGHDDDDYEHEEVKNGKKKKGFWSKLLRFKGKLNKDVLTHSTSMRLIIGKV